MEPYADHVLWVVVLGFIVSFVMAFGIGANDVANSFGSSVGAKVLTIRQACIIGTIFEISGSVLLGYKVSDTVRKGILDISVYEGHAPELMLGSLSALAGSALWLLAATFLKMPISGTHSIVGATIGFSLVARGLSGVNWPMFGKIVISWFISPLLSGTMSAALFLLIRKFILKTPRPLEPGLRALPFFYGGTLFVNIFSVVADGPSLLYFDRIPIWGAFVIAIGIGLTSGLVVQFFVAPRMKRTVLREIAQRQQCSFVIGGSAASSLDPSPNVSKNISLTDLSSQPNAPINDKITAIDKKKVMEKKNGLVNGTANGMKDKMENGNKMLTVARYSEVEKGLPANGSAAPLITNTSVVILNDGDTSDDSKDNDPPEVSHLFSFLQILTATFGSFAHGGNDVSNAIGPLIALWLIYVEGGVEQKAETPLYLLFYGGIGIAVGLWVWGRRVIETLGEDLTKITPSSGFTIEIGSAFTVLVASKIGLPISTTHCKVGSVVFTGWARSSRSGVDWHLFRNIVFAWLVTVPVAGGLSAIVMAILRAFALPSLQQQ